MPASCTDHDAGLGMLGKKQSRLGVDVELRSAVIKACMARVVSKTVLNSAVLPN